SGRRRPTRIARDWSAAVCSSDLGAKRACLAQSPSGGRTSHSFPYANATSARGTSTKSGTSCADVDVTHILWALAVFPLSQYRTGSRSYAADQSPSLFYLRVLIEAFAPAGVFVYFLR